MAAAMRPVLAPSFSMAAIVLPARPASAPFQPAWAAPITPASASANSTGAQSAVRMPSIDARQIGHHAVAFRPGGEVPIRANGMDIGAVNLRQATPAWPRAPARPRRGRDFRPRRRAHRANRDRNSGWHRHRSRRRRRGRKSHARCRARVQACAARMDFYRGRLHQNPGEAGAAGGDSARPGTRSPSGPAPSSVPRR